MKPRPCARCKCSPYADHLTMGWEAFCPECYPGEPDMPPRSDTGFGRTKDEALESWNELQDRIADKLRPSPKGPATMPQQQKIVEYYFNAVPGAIDLSMESDADVFSIRDVVGQRIALSATVNVENPGPVESRVYWIANSGALLPMEQFVGWRKKYIGSVVVSADANVCHVWEMRDLSMKSLSELFGSGDLNELVRSIGAGDEIDATQYTAEQLGWILSHIGELNEWADGERRIAELRTLLVASLTK